MGKKKIVNVSDRVKVGFVGTCECYYTDESGIRLYRTGNLQKGRLVEDDMKYVLKKFHEANKKSQLHKWDILIARHGNSGNAVLYDSDEEANCLNIVIIRPDLKVVNPKFMVENINSASVEKQVCRLKNGSTQVVLNTKAIEDLDVGIPCLPEQQKIAEFLSTIDTVIEKQKETVSAWEERKKGVMQKLFSQEVKFKADDGSDFPEWEEKKLGDVADFFNGDRSARYPKETDFVKYGVAFLNTENLHNTIVDISEKCKYITYEKYCELSGAKIQLLDIIYCLRGSVGLCSLNTILEEGTVASSLMVIRAVEGIIDPIYLYNSLNSDFVLGQLYQCLNGSCAGNLSAKDMAMFKIKCPCLAEQQRIADCLSSLDDVIAKQKATLAAWEELKKGLLQQMFV